MPTDMINEILHGVNDKDLINLSHVNRRLFQLTQRVPLKAVYSITHMHYIPSRFQVTKVQINTGYNNTYQNILSLPSDLQEIYIPQQLISTSIEKAIKTLFKRSRKLSKVRIGKIFGSLSLFNGSVKHLKELYIEKGPIDIFSDISFFKSLTVLSLPREFNEPIDVLSQLTNLRILTFDTQFNQSLAPLAGLSLYSLELGFSFVQSLGALRSMKSLRVLIFFPFEEKELGHIPSEIEIIEFRSRWSYPYHYWSNWKNLKKVSFFGFTSENLSISHEDVSQWANTLYYLKLGKGYEGSLDFLGTLKNLQSLHFPDTSPDMNILCAHDHLTDIKIPTLIGYPLEQRKNIEKLSFTSSFCEPITEETTKSFPAVIRLSLGKLFHYRIDSFIHWTNMREIRFSDGFNEPIEVLKYMPQLRIIEFRQRFNQSIEVLKQLRYIREVIFGRDFNQSIDVLSHLAGTLEILEFGGAFNQSIESIYSLEYLEYLDMNVSTAVIDEKLLIERLENLIFARVNGKIIIY